VRVNDETAAQKARTLANRLAEVAQSMGAEQVIVMIGLPDGNHSAYAYRTVGACLPVRGLLETCAEGVRAGLVYPTK
jgi:sugar phosphate isomerase/epimerase